MYDNVKFEFQCPKCGRMLDSFQSKDRDCVMDTLKPEDVWNWYIFCSCGQWIEFEWEKDFSKKPKMRLEHVARGSALVVSDALKDALKDAQDGTSPSDPQCECGHPQSWHGDGNGLGACDGDSMACKCKKFRRRVFQ